MAMQPVSTRLQSAIELEGEETPVVDSGPIKHAAAEVYRGEHRYPGYRDHRD